MRTLETMIRLATAHSKLRLGKVVSTSDIDVAVNLIHLSIFGEPMDEGDEDEQPASFSKPMAAAAPARSDQNMQSSRAARAGRGRMEGVEQASKKRVKFQGGDEDDDDDFQGDQGGLTGQLGERRSTRRSAAQGLEEPAPSKKMKIDDEQQLRELLQGSTTYDAASQAKLMAVKRFVYKLGAAARQATGSSRVPVSALWQRYFQLPEAEQLNAETGVAFLADRAALVDALQHMEAEDLVALEGDEVIMI